MLFHAFRHLTPLAFVLTGTSVWAAASHPVLDPNATTQSVAKILPSLGLGPMDSLQAQDSQPDSKGGTRTRFTQAYRGIPVFQSGASATLDAAGNLSISGADLQRGIDLPAVPLLAEAKVRTLSLRQLPPMPRPWRLRIEPLVFPTRFQDGFKAASRGLDDLLSVATPRKAEPYRWAFQVTALTERGRRPEGLILILDALTGEVLKKEWAVEYEGGRGPTLPAMPLPSAQMTHGVFQATAPLLPQEERVVLAAPFRVVDTPERVGAPARGTGLSQYSGQVALDTVQMPDGSFALRDATRATRRYPGSYAMLEEGIREIGSQTRCENDDPWSSSLDLFSNPTNNWGNGRAFNPRTDYPGERLSPKGQTAGVDAHFAVQSVWDYYTNVLGRSGGIDGKGSSLVVTLHARGFSDNAPVAGWLRGDFLVSANDEAPTGSVTCLDAMAGAIGNGLLQATTNLDRGGESGLIREADKAVHAAMVHFYVWGANGQGNVVPNTTTHAPGGRNTPEYLWSLGAQMSLDGLTPLTAFDRPSRVKGGYDAWFCGIGNEEADAAKGPLIRAFYYLSQGTSADATANGFSSFLPRRTEGIGNQKAIRLWYGTMTSARRPLDPLTDMHGFREAMIATAREQYPAVGGQDAVEVQAVMNAFGAVNIGSAAGQPEPVRVIYPKDPVFPQELLYNDGLIVAAGIMVTLPTPQVKNTSDRSVSFTLGGSNIDPAMGRLDGNRFQAPLMGGGTWCPVKVSSKADPRQFALLKVLGVSLDADSDSEMDACDMGALALAYGDIPVYPGAKLLGGGVSDREVGVFATAFRNSFNAVP